MKNLIKLILNLILPAIFVVAPIDALSQTESTTNDPGVISKAENKSSQEIDHQVSQKNNLDNNRNEKSDDKALEWFKAISAFLQSLAWPFVLLMIFFVFQNELKTILNNFSGGMQSGKVKLLGAEFEVNYVKNSADFHTKESKEGDKPQIIGNPDQFELLFKAASSDLMKSTKVMNTPEGCIVQVSTKEIASNGAIGVAEALTFVPGVNVIIKRNDKNEIIDTKFSTLSK